MRASEIKKQFVSSTSPSAGQIVEKLETLQSPEARAMVKQLADSEQAVVIAVANHDQQWLLTRAVIEGAEKSSGILAASIKGSVEIARLEAISEAATYVAIDAENASKLAEHLESVFSGRGPFGQTVAQQLRLARHDADVTQARRDLAKGLLDRDERALAGALLRLRGSIEAAKALLHINGVSIVVPRSPKKKPAAQAEGAAAPLLTVVPGPTAGPTTPSTGNGADSAQPAPAADPTIGVG